MYFIDFFPLVNFYVTVALAQIQQCSPTFVKIIVFVTTMTKM